MAFLQDYHTIYNLEISTFSVQKMTTWVPVQFKPRFFQLANKIIKNLLFVNKLALLFIPTISKSKQTKPWGKKLCIMRYECD